MLLRALVGCLLLLGAAQVLAQSNNPLFEQPDLVAPDGESREGHGQIGFHLGYYDSDDSGDGNPFYDESLTVVEPVVFFNYYWNHSTSIYGTFSYDYVSSASIERLDTYEVTAATSGTYVAQTGATGDNYFGLELGSRRHLSETTTIGLYTAYSIEYDYESFAVGGDFSHSVADGNATISGSLRAYRDELDVILFNGNEEGTEHRTSLAGSLRWYQVLDPKTHGEFGLTLGYQDGYLATPYNAVVIEDPLLPPNPYLENNASGTEIRENLPSSRLRASIFGHARRLIWPSIAAELGTRIYGDTWGLFSVAVEPQLFSWLITDRLRLRVRYRYYVQSAVDDYEENFTVVTRYRTQDSDLGDFDSHTFGLQFRWYRSEGEYFDLGADYVVRSDYLDQFIASVGWSYAF